MTGRIGITCAPKSNGSSNKDLYFKSVEVLETTYNSVKLSYLVNIDDSDHNKFKIQTEVNGELYNDITVDKVNRTVTINNLNPETDYDINLIASFEPYVERSKTIKQRTIKAPPATLVDGQTLNNKIVETWNKDGGDDPSGIINFIKGNIKEYKSKNKYYADVSEKQDGSIFVFMSSHYSPVNIVSEGEIFANQNSENMFPFMGTLLINFENFNTSNMIKTNMFVDSIDIQSIENLKIQGEKDINLTEMFSFDKYYLCGNITIENPNITSYANMFENCSTIDNSKFIVKYTSPETRKVAEKMVATKSPNSNVYLDGDQPI